MSFPHAFVARALFTLWSFRNASSEYALSLFLARSLVFSLTHDLSFSLLSFPRSFVGLALSRFLSLGFPSRLRRACYLSLSLSLSLVIGTTSGRVLRARSRGLRGLRRLPRRCRPVVSVGAREELKTRGGSLSSEGTNAAVKAERSAPIKVLRSLAYINIPIVNDIATYNCIIGVHLHGQSCTHIVQGRRYSETQIDDEVEVVHEYQRQSNF